MSASVEEKNKYGFRTAMGGTEGFTRFTPPSKTDTSSKTADSSSNPLASSEGVDPEIVRRAEEQSKTMIKSAAGNLMNSMTVVNVAKMALVGMVGGALYGLAKGTAETQGVLYELKYKTVAFDMDPFASQLFKKLERYEQLQSEAYKLAIHYCDKLFLLERSLSTSRPKDSDIPMAQACIDGVLGQIMILRNHSQSGEQRGDINILKMQINEMLSEHRERIYSRCALFRL